MRAVKASGGKPEVVDVPTPSGEGVLVDVRAAGICGSDLHMLESGLVGTQVLGHEVAGVAPDGTPVAIEPLSPCGSCVECARGDYNVCESGFTIIHGIARDGGMAEQMLVPERSLVPLPLRMKLQT